MNFGPDIPMYRPRKKTWKNMERWKRKQFHRENEIRRIHGLKPLPKP